MLGNLGLHVQRYPSGRYGFVGTVPVVLGYVHKDTGTLPTPDDARRIVMFGPAIVGYRSRTYPTLADARQAASNAGATLCASPACACASLA